MLKPKINSLFEQIDQNQKEKVLASSCKKYIIKVF